MSKSNLKIVAELAQGFEGSLTQARLLLKAAAKAGADSAKFQLVFADELATPDYKYYKLFQTLEMRDEEWADLAALAKSLGIGLDLDIFGSRSLTLAESIGVESVKLHGTDIANVGLLKQVADSSVSEVYLGAGGAYLSEIEKASEILARKSLVIILGFQGYPTPNDTNQISRVSLLKQKFSSNNIKIGFADHVLADSTSKYALAAVALGCGATVIEKHLTLGKCMQLEDYEAALNPDEFAEFSLLLRELDMALGSCRNTETFDMSESEEAYRKNIRRDVVMLSTLGAGDMLCPEHLCLKRTSAVGALKNLDLAYNKRLRTGVQANKALLTSDLQS